MDIDADSFPHQLLGLLKAISEADLVSFDLELTGIPSRLPGREPWKPRQGGERKTLEDRYQETKEAAGRYQILQAGFTCAKFDYSANKYVLRPYNISVSPLLNEDLRLDFEREIHIQTGAATFLLNHGFDLGAPFARGVQYLSREEAFNVMHRTNERLDKKPDVADMQLKETDTQALDFVRRIREAISTWKNAEDGDGTLEVTTHTGLAERPFESVITNFEKRLVHQLVRAEYPDLVTVSRRECIRIIYYDELREAENKRHIKRRVKENIAKQTGLRWVFEALAADGDLEQADPHYFGKYSQYIIAERGSDTKELFDLAHERLRKHKPVLVGHNMFTDLVYFYRTFVGELPDTLDDFCEALHQLFLKIIDTKYLATHAEGDLNASPTLQEIAEKIERQPLPDIVTHSEHSKYHDEVKFHEAGYDSLLTATILLRLAAKLDVDRHHDSDSEASFRTAVEQPNGNSKARVDKLQTLQETPSQPQPPHQELIVVKKKGKKAKKSKNVSEPAPTSSRFQSRNIFDQLSLDEQGPSSPSDEDQGGVAVGNWQDTIDDLDSSNWSPIETRQREPMEMIPTWNSDFWQQFGNTLRVYGTQEAVLKIAKWDA